MSINANSDILIPLNAAPNISVVISTHVSPGVPPVAGTVASESNVAYNLNSAPVASDADNCNAKFLYDSASISMK